MILMTGPALHLMLENLVWVKMMSRGNASNAEQAAKDTWAMEMERVDKEGFALFPFSHTKLRNIYFILAVRPDHPNIGMFLELKKGDVVKFEPLPQVPDGAPEDDLASYLRIGSVCHD